MTLPKVNLLGELGGKFEAGEYLVFKAELKMVVEQHKEFHK
jgi:hypothetical protein